MKASQTAYFGLIELKERYKENGKIVKERWHCRDRFAKRWWLRPYNVISKFLRVWY